MWIGTAAGVPIDGDDQAVLVREQADRGALSLLDMATGTIRWTIPDPGLETTSASWRTIVTQSRVALQGWDDEGPATQVYDSTTGAEIGHYRGWLQAAGTDWVAVLLTSVRERQLDFHD